MKYDMVLYYYGGRSLHKLQNMLTPFLKRSFFLQKGNQKICTDSVFAMMVAGNLWVVFWQRKNVFC